MAIRNGWYLLAWPATNLSCSNPSSRRYLCWADWVSLRGLFRPSFSPAHNLANRGAAFCLSSFLPPRVFLVGSGVLFPFRGSIQHLKLTRSQRCCDFLVLNNFGWPLSGASALSPHKPRNVISIPTLPREAAALPLWADQRPGDPATGLPCLSATLRHSLGLHFSVSDTARSGTAAPQHFTERSPFLSNQPHNPASLPSWPVLNRLSVGHSPCCLALGP